jgi:hypothetical protein
LIAFFRFCKRALAELDARGICASVRLVRRVRDHMVDHVPGHVMFQQKFPFESYDKNNNFTKIKIKMISPHAV